MALREVERLGPSRLAEFDWQLAPTVHMVHGVMGYGLMD
jgi:hypothetical protein